MYLLRLLIQTLSLLLFVAIGTGLAFSAQGDWTRVSYSVEAQEFCALPVNLTNTARAPPTTRANVKARGATLAQTGHLSALHDVETFVAALSFDGSSIATKRGTGGLYDPRAWRQNYEDFYSGKVTSTTVPPYNAPNVRLAGQAHPRTGVVFDQRGFPIFDDVARYDTRLSANQFRATDYQGQMRMATRDLRDTIATSPQLKARFTKSQLDAIQGGKAKIPDFTWHHHQDTGRMQLVPSTTHHRTGHIGSESLSGGK